MREMELYRALNASVTACQPSDYWKNRMVRQIVKGEDMRKRTKLSVGAILLAALLVISAVALAVGVLVNEYYAKVEQMDREGSLKRWQPEDRIRFVTVMKECNFELPEDLYRQVSDESLPEEERAAAADQVINGIYGKLIRQNLHYYVTTEEDSLGMPPDLAAVFSERYFADHPDWEETGEGILAYFDALGYYLRDEAGIDRFPDTVPAQPVIDETYAANALKEVMVKKYGWDPEAVEAMTPEVEWDEAYRMWLVSGEVSDESMDHMTDYRKGMEPMLYGDNIEVTEDCSGYRARILVDERGNRWTKDLNREDFRRAYPGKGLPVRKISMKQALETAEAAVQEKYRLDDAEMKKLFAGAENAGTGEADGLLVLVEFRRHYNYYTEEDMMYGAVVNMATGKAECAVSYHAEEQPPEWQLLEYAAETEQQEGWYTSWEPESRQGLADRIRACGLLPGNACWQADRPTEAETDALVAELFGAGDRLYLLNTRAMLRTLKGPEDTWDTETRILADWLCVRHMISEEDLLAKQQPAAGGIDADTAAGIVKAAVCEAWDMPADALDGWTVSARLVQNRAPEDESRPDPFKDIPVCYRVFLVRPDAEAGQDTFGGKDSLNYRVATDGTLLTDKNYPGWYSPEEDRERWGK